MEHITTLSLHLESRNLSEGGLSQPFSLGPMLQSVLLEQVDGFYAQQLHASIQNPYSQYCYVSDDGDLVWLISVLTDEAAKYLIEPASKIETFTLKNIDGTFSVARRKIDSFGIDHLLSKLQGDSDSSFRLRFVTPTSFKSKGHYVIMPDVHLIFQNLLMRYNQVYAGDNEIDSETLEYITEHVRITSYNLRSKYYPRTMAKADKIPDFTGSLTIHVTGPQSLRGLVSMLLTFGEASGVGIKTSMGMGGMQLVKNMPVRKGGVSGR